MSDDAERHALVLLVNFFCALAGGQQPLSDRTGIDQRRISRYQTLDVRPGRPTLERMARGTGVSSERLDQLLALYRAICAEIEARSPAEPMAAELAAQDEFREDLEQVTAEIASRTKADLHEALLALEAALAVGDPPLSPHEARDLAADQWRRILPLSHAIRQDAFEFDEFSNWALCERLCEESLQAITDDPATARELAEEALTLAENISAGDTTRQRLIAYALAHMAQVDSRCGDIEEAVEKIRRAREMWQPGDGSDSLEEARFEALLSGSS